MKSVMNLYSYKIFKLDKLFFHWWINIINNRIGDAKATIISI